MSHLDHLRLCVRDRVDLLPREHTRCEAVRLLPLCLVLKLPTSGEHLLHPLFEGLLTFVLLYLDLHTTDPLARGALNLRDLYIHVLITSADDPRQIRPRVLATLDSGRERVSRPYVRPRRVGDRGFDEIVGSAVAVVVDVYLARHDLEVDRAASERHISRGVVGSEPLVDAAVLDTAVAVARARVLRNRSVDD